MSTNLVTFKTTVSRSGYRWIEVSSTSQPSLPDPLPPGASQVERNRHWMDEKKAEPRWFLTDGIPLGAERRSFDIRQPLRENPGRLHRVFSETEPSQDGIRAFANNFGQIGTLGDLSELVPLEHIREKNDGVPIGVGDELHSCQQEIRKLRLAVQLWEWVQSKNETALKNFFHWRGNEVSFSWFEDEWSFESKVIAPSVREHLLAIVEPGNVLIPATVQVQRFVNDALYERQRAGPRLVLNHRTKQLEHHLIPNSLIGAIWLDFHLAVNGGVQYRRCENCKGAFPVGGRGRAKKFCSDRCRVAHNRKLKKAESEMMS